MNTAIAELTASLPGHDISIKARPDGMFLLRICKDGDEVFLKAVERDSIVSESGIRALQHEILRDRKLVSGEVSWKGAGAHWVSRQLPTFTGAPVNPTAAKMMWKRRAGSSQQLRPTA